MNPGHNSYFRFPQCNSNGVLIVKMFNHQACTGIVLLVSWLHKATTDLYAWHHPLTNLCDLLLSVVMWVTFSYELCPKIHHSLDREVRWFKTPWTIHVSFFKEYYVTDGGAKKADSCVCPGLATYTAVLFSHQLNGGADVESKCTTHACMYMKTVYN